MPVAVGAAAMSPVLASLVVRDNGFEDFDREGLGTANLLISVL